jgi:hypothetical protein
MDLKDFGRVRESGLIARVNKATGRDLVSIFNKTNERLMPNSVRNNGIFFTRGEVNSKSRITG